MFENPFRNTHGWAQGWKHHYEVDEILPFNALDEPAYMPKDPNLNSNSKTSILSFTNDWNICKFTLKLDGHIKQLD